MADPAETDDEDSGAIPAAAAPTSAPAPAPAPATAAPAGPNLDALIIPPERLEAARQQMLANQQAKTASNAAIAGETTRRLDADRARMENAYKASAAVPDELNHPWNADAERARTRTDPMESFGSVGMVFAMLAPAFAGLPMSASLNAGAAALNAIKEGDEKAYQQNFEAFKTNTDLALKRHDIMRQAYNDATTLMNSNINAGRTKMELAATKFNDKQAQILLENGMDDQLASLFTKRNEAALKLQQDWDTVQLQHDKMMDLRGDPRYTSGDPAQKDAAVRDWIQRWGPNGRAQQKYDFTQEYISRKKAENPSWTASDLAGWRKEAADAEEPTESEKQGVLTEGRQKAAEIKRRQDEYTAGGMDPGQAYQKAAQEVASINRGISGNRADDLRGRIDMADKIIEGSQKNIDFLKNYKMGAGIGGKIMRGEEIAENIAGISDQTDRMQFRRRVLELQEMAPRIFTDSNGRPLAAAQKKIDSIVAGLEAGDTGPNTIRAYEELVNDMRDRIEAYKRRLNNGVAPGGSNPEGTGVSRPAAGSSRGTPKWQSAPIVSPAAPGPRSDIESDTNYG